MKNLFTNIKAKLHQFMSGRYGYDELSRFLWITALIFMILGIFPVFGLLGIVSFVLLIWVLFRSFSRNISRRQQERNAYLAWIGRIKGWFSWKKQAWQARKTHRLFRCKQCGKMLRVPKGKGKIKITCPQCRSELIKKT